MELMNGFWNYWDSEKRPPSCLQRLRTYRISQRLDLVATSLEIGIRAVMTSARVSIKIPTESRWQDEHGYIDNQYTTWAESPPASGNDRDATSQRIVLLGPFGDGNRRD